MESSHFIPLLRSNYLTTLTFSYLSQIKEVCLLIRSLSKRGILFLQSNEQQLLHFCTSIPKEEIIFHLNAIWFVRPFQTRHVNVLSFVAMSDDLYKVKDFAEGCLSFGNISFGNQHFNMNTAGKDPELDRQNEETLCLLAGKTKKVTLNRFYKSHEVLKRLVANPSKFQNIEGLSVEFHKDYIPLLKQMNKLTNVRDLSIFQPYGMAQDNSQIQNYSEMFEEVFINDFISIINSFDREEGKARLQKLAVVPMMHSSMRVLRHCQKSIKDVEYLDICVSSDKCEIISHLDVFKQLHKLQKLKLSRGVIDLKVLRQLPQLKDLEICERLVQIQSDYIENGDLKHLEKLILSGMQDLAKHEDILQELIRSKNLRELEACISDSRLIDQLFSDNTSLQTLKLSKLISNDLSILGQLSQNHSIKALTIELKRQKQDKSKFITDPIFNELQNTTLESLVIKGSFYTSNKDERYNLHPVYFCSMLQMFKKLVTLKLDNFQFTPELIEHVLIPLLITNPEPTIKVLQLRHCVFKYNCISLLLKALASKPYLFTDFALTDCNIKQENVEDLIAFVNNNRTIQKLEIQNAEIALDPHFINLMKAVAQHPSIRYLDLCQCKIGYQKTLDNAKLFHSTILSTCSNLEYLYLKEPKTNNTNNDVDEYKETMLLDFKEKLIKMIELKF